MTVARTWSVGLSGMYGAMVEIEVDIGQGVPGVTLVGLPDAVVRQSVDRVRAAIANTGGTFPYRKITIGLSPASMPKQGSGFDLAIAVAVLGAAGAVAADTLDDLVFLGELGLDGSVRGIRGVLPAVLEAARAGHRRVVVPVAERRRGRAGRPGRGAAGRRSARGDRAPAGRASAAHALARRRRRRHRPARTSPTSWARRRDGGRSRSPPRGDTTCYLAGPPGAGKTMLAERLPGLLPPLDERAALEVTAIHSIAGTLPSGAPLLTRPPFEAPHHSATRAALVGGGSGVVRPGAMSRAHRGVLFLDEAPEFPRWVLDGMRQPLEMRCRDDRPRGRGRHVPVPHPARPRGQPLPVRDGCR